MSLFDVIKYSGTDLNSRAELEALPEELFGLYRIAAFKYYGALCSMTSARGDRIEGMAEWIEGDIIKRAIFDKTLKEWNNELV